MTHRHRSLLFVLFFCSGLGTLMLEVLWLRQLALLFGNTVQAAAVTLSVFFLGLALGGQFWGRRAANLSNPLRGYALLELGVAATGPLFLLLRNVYRAVYAPMFAPIVDHPALIVMGKLILATAILFPPAFLMGGTFPLMGHYLIRRKDTLGTTGSLLYALNTLGAAAGTLVAGYSLPRTMGLTWSGLLAAAIMLAVGMTALWASTTTGPTPASPQPRPATSVAPGSRSGPRPWVAPLAVASGFVTLALEVLWTRMFAQVLQNSVYSFAVVLFMFLVSLGLGSFVARRLAKLDVPPMITLAILLALGGISVAGVPWFFYWITDGLTFVAPQADWGDYVQAVFATAAAVTIVPVTLVGAVFPFLLRIEQDGREQIGHTIGRLISLNALGAIVGPLVAGFLVLEVLGLWSSITGLGYTYVLLSAAVLWRSVPRPILSTIPLLSLGGVMVVMGQAGLPPVRIEAGQQLRAVWESNAGTVAVVQEGDNLKILLDNYYTLGDTRSLAVERMQAHLPLLLHPNPRETFFLGLGSGITAGAALAHPVTSVVAAELVPDVVRAVHEFFGPYTNNLSTDPRVDIVVEDGRNYLLATRQTYDVIVGDLFTPWHAGTGSLYTLEHFRRVRDRLRTEGVFAQWLPLYQLSEAEFLTITRTMAEVFPEVTMWRGDFAPDRPIVALVGRMVAQPLDWERFVRHSRQFFAADAERDNMIGLFYAGNIGANRSMFDAYPINTDDRPVIEYLAPITQRRSAAGQDRRLVRSALDRFLADLLRRSPPGADPFLSRFPPRELEYVTAGLTFFRYQAALAEGDSSRAQHVVAGLRSALPDGPWKLVTEPGSRR